MTGFLKVIGLLALVWHCNGLSRSHQADDYGNDDAVSRLQSGRRFAFPQGSVIIGAPSYPNHLPEAEALLPGHTLIRPGLGMLKSAVKFPHRELEAGSGVYGNLDNIGIRYDGKNERVLYTGFRRSNSNDPIVAFLPLESIYHRSEIKKDTHELLNKIIQEMLKTTVEKGNSERSFENRYSSGEARNFGRRNGKDKLFSYTLKGGLRINGLNKAIEKTLKSLNLKDFVQTKYIDSIINTLRSLRRYKNNDNNEKVQQYLLEKDEEMFDKDVYYNELKTPNGKHDPNDKVLENNFDMESEEINTTPKSNADVTPELIAETREQRKREWFWQTKDAGNHIKINQNALDFEEFLPKLSQKEDMGQIQSWWFYNQADHTQLQEKRKND